jgi:hypothetical protein
MSCVKVVLGALVAVTAFGGSVGCKSEPSSEIVQRVKAAGAGDVEHATVRSLSDWFRSRKDLTMEIASKCKALDKTKQQADWRQSTEGRVCDAAIGESWRFAPPENPGGHDF